ncbi:two component transcriptional regulator, AraC family protein [Paenibacillus vortex V453]|uniref:Two component transcriptional regulator, AraC family protein n=1 Tax=Paenibacillus vortex V453 TaxID=715225 RepID=A0A2R9STV8_9BACL|nr:response regulator [Paenibacillus vortex]EFU40806.1 two component transcriptional regulator, AraC family protein [Paenibacillus vortex V453]
MWRTLIVEDEQYARASLRKLFVKADIPFEIVGEAVNGEEGLQLIRELQPDVVISDIFMPRMDGVRLLQLTREEGFQCRFVMLTAVSEFEYARQAVEYGASGYLMKLSLDLKGLKQAMDKVAAELTRMDKLRLADKWFPDRTAQEPTDHPELNRMINYIEEHFAEEVTLKRLAEFVRMDASYVSDLFKKKTGTTLTHFIQNRRVQAAKMLLSETEKTVSEIGRMVGFENDNYFIKIFKRWCGVTPNEYRKEQKFVL